jgi:RNA polymerase sigma-70 factor (ECF subfamily)
MAPAQRTAPMAHGRLGEAPHTLRAVNRSPQPRSATPVNTAAADAEELDLVRQIQAGGVGSRTAWAELLKRYQDRLFGVCVRMVGDRERAGDYTQDAMVKIIEGLGTFDGRAKLSTWMIRVTMNVCLSRLRSEKLRRHASLEGMADGQARRSGGGGAAGGRSAADRLAELQDREPGGEHGVQRAQLRRLLSEGLQRISPEQRAILVLRDSRGLDYEQIAEVLGVPTGTVKSRLFRARAALRDVLEGLEPGIGEMVEGGSDEE